jgi:hypothetical protein
VKPRIRRSAAERQAYYAGRLAQEREWEGRGAPRNPHPEGSAEAQEFQHGVRDRTVEEHGGYHE